VTPDHHAARAERIAAALEKCTVDDYEAVIETAMLAGTHWFNVALHRMGLTGENEDVMHAEYLTGAMRLKLSLIEPEMLSALDRIEALRPGYVRGDEEGGRGAAEEALRLLDLIRRTALGAKSFRPVRPAGVKRSGP
jgi:hypothetical protein